jgi:hypothetical protein
VEWCRDVVEMDELKMGWVSHSVSVRDEKEFRSQIKFIRRFLHQLNRLHHRNSLSLYLLE